MSYLVDPSRVLLITYSNRTGDFLPAWNVTQRYALLWGYRTRLINAPPRHPEFHAAFERLDYIGMALNEEIVRQPNTRRWDVVVWLDDDSFVANPGLGVSHWLTQMAAAEILMAKDAASAFVPMNTGVLVIRNTPWTRNFYNGGLLNECTTAEKTSQVCCWEQDCLARISRTGVQVGGVTAALKIALVDAFDFNFAVLYANGT